MMNRNDWQGVMPAITTPFDSNLGVDVAFLRSHVAWLVDAGCTGIVTPGSLGEGATLSLDERRTIWRTCLESVGARVPIVAAIASAGTREAVEQAKEAERCGCRGLMVLPPYVYKGAWRETKAHFGVILNATRLSCMLYNNPIAYGTDTTPEQIAELASEHANLHAVKESSADVRRITAIRAIVRDRLALFVGVDDLIVEGVGAGATGWVAGLVNAFPRESVALFDAAKKGQHERARAIYEWFLPMLRMDVVPEFVHLIKLVQERIGKGSERVRGPRLVIEGEQRARAIAAVEEALRTRGSVAW